MTPRESYVMRNGRLIPKAEAPPLAPVYGRGPVIMADHYHDKPWRGPGGEVLDSRQSVREQLRRTGGVHPAEPAEHFASADPEPLISSDDAPSDVRRGLHEMRRITENYDSVTPELQHKLSSMREKADG